MDDPIVNESVRKGLSQEWFREQICVRMKRDHAPTGARRVTCQASIAGWKCSKMAIKAVCHCGMAVTAAAKGRTIETALENR
jgi:hypothetical protein